VTEKEYTQISNKAKIAMMIKISDEIERSSEYVVMESDIGPIVRRLYKILQDLNKEITWRDKEITWRD